MGSVQIHGNLIVKWKVASGSRHLGFHYVGVADLGYLGYPRFISFVYIYRGSFKPVRSIICTSIHYIRIRFECKSHRAFFHYIRIPMPEFVKASVTIDGDNASSWSIPISSGNLYQAIGELRREVLAYYGGIVPNAGLPDQQDDDVESDDGTKPALPC